MTAPGVVIRNAAGHTDIAEARRLFLEYAQSLDFDLCFQDFDAELAALPGKYAAPQGCLLLAVVDGRTAGVVGLRPLKDGVCEMKRLYVRPSFRGHALGRHLAVAAVDAAREIGYAMMRLDTLPDMRAARVIYDFLGFVEGPAYYRNPLDGVSYLELDLTQREETA